MVPDLAPINIGDEVLIEQCQSGDTSAMERLILKYQNRLYNVILRICSNPDDAAELTQETFVKVIENIGRFQGKSSFYTWAFRIAVNLTINYCKRNARLGLKSLDSDESESGDQATGVLKDYLSNDKSPDPASIAQNRELCDLVMQSMTRLDEDHRTILVLRDIEGMSYSQISQVLELELGTVRSRISRARGKFKDILETVIE
ncbi:MAG: sigma-70 family RNA polymerase sigma factor [Phycisphaerae bacterium]|nr:sigma-70 family RNA polymerase sigma factor [Phycisphaerae bacterium]